MIHVAFVHLFGVNTIVAHFFFECRLCKSEVIDKVRPRLIERGYMGRQCGSEVYFQGREGRSDLCLNSGGDIFLEDLRALIR